jgi:hypothetical protein
MICTYCGIDKMAQSAIKNHEIRCKKNPNRKISIIDYSKRKTSNAVLKAKELGLPIPTSPCKGKMGKKGHPHSEEFKLKQRLNAISRQIGGVRQSRWIKYNGKTLGSSYELEVVKSLDENNIIWDTCKRFNYIDPNGKARTYTPDIYLVDYDIYLDPKNDFLINNINPSLGYKDSEKIQKVSEQNNIRIIILDKNHLNWETIKTLL